MADLAKARPWFTRELKIVVAVWALLITFYIAGSMYLWKGHLDSPAPAKVELKVTAENADLIKGLFDRRYNAYIGALAAIRTNLERQGLLLGLLVLLLFGWVSGDLKAGWVALTEKAMKLLTYMIPLGLLYLWFDFGYLYHGAIDNRHALLRLVEIRECMIPIDLNTAPLLSDQLSVVDLWYRWFEDERLELSTVHIKGGLWLIYMPRTLFLMGIMGASHAGSLLPFFLEAYRYPSRNPGGRRNWMLLLVVVLSILLLLTHVEFGWIGKKPNWGQFGVMA